MRKSHRSSGIGKKSLKVRLLLAYNAQRRDKTCQEMQSLPGARQNLSPPIQAPDVGHNPLTFSVVGVGHIGTSAYWKGPMQNHHCSSGLFHQMGRSRTSGCYHITEDTQLRVAFHNMQVWHPRALVSYNGKQFDNLKFRDFCAELGINNYYSSPAHPQSNG